MDIKKAIRISELIKVLNNSANQVDALRKSLLLGEFEVGPRDEVAQIAELHFLQALAQLEMARCSLRLAVKSFRYDE